MIPGARVVVLGRQGAGKGTQGERLARLLAVPHLSSGDQLRAAVAAGTAAGQAAEAAMLAGELVSDDIVFDIMGERLARPDAARRGFVLDGFPRTRSQAEALLKLLLPAGLDAAIDIDVPRDLVLERIAGRARSDDAPEAVKRRLEIYDEETVPLLRWFEEHGLLVTVDGVGTADEVEQRVLAAVRPELFSKAAR